MGQAPSDDPFYTVAGDTIYGTYIPSDTSSSGGSSGGSAPGTGPGSVIAESSGGITINLLFDAAAMAAPASFRAGIAQAAAILASTISDKITVNLNIDYSGTGGGAAAGPDSGLFENYSTIRSDMVNGATPGDGTFNALPTGSSIQGQSYVAVWNAQLKLWGFLGANDTTTDDGSATFATDINPNLLVGVALHELTHAMGRVPYGPQPDVFDLFRFTSVGTRLFAGGNTAPAAYFSTDGGHTKIADLGQYSDPSDFLNSGVQGPNDPFNEYYDGSTIQSLSAADKAMLDSLGFHVFTPTQPDLTEYVAVNNTTVGAGGSLTIDAYDMNVGNGASAGSTAQIYLSTDPTITTSDTVLATLTTTGTLAPVGQAGYYDHQTVTVNLPGNLAPGTYYIGGITDYNNHVGESNEANNTYNVVAITVAGVAQPDLTEYVAVNTTTAVAGGSVTVDAYDMNVGDGTSAGSTAQIYLSADPTITTGDMVLATLTTTGPLTSVGEAGYYDHQTITVNLPGNLAPGTYYIGGIADYNNHVSETNEANNTYNVVAITVTAPPQPDLAEYVAVDKTTVGAGGSLVIDAYDMNIGDAVSAGSTAQIYLSTDPNITTSDTVIATLTTSGQLSTVGQPGYYDHQTVTVNLPGNLAPGTYYIGGIADYNNHVSESNEANNTYNVASITVTAPSQTAPAQPDLSEYVAVNKTMVDSGGSITIDAYDMNLGNSVSGGSNAQIYLSTDQTITTSDTVLATLTTPGMLATVSQPGYYDHQTVTVNLPGNLAPGTYYIGGIADYDNHVAESNETNNTYNVVQITVTTPQPTAPTGQANNDLFVFADNNSPAPAMADFSAPAAQAAMSELASVFNSAAAEAQFLFALAAGNHDAVGYFSALEASPHPDAHLVQLMNSFIIH